MVRRARAALLFLTLACFFCSLVSVLAQSPQATISGIVTDPSGAVIPGVSVTAISLSTDHRTVAVTNDQGFFVLSQLPIGSYKVEAEISGFSKYIRTGITLTTAATVALDVKMEVGSVSNVITVTDEAPLLQTRTSDVGQLLESKTVEDLPLGDRRTMNIVKMTGGAVFVNYDNGAKPNFSIAGGRTQSQMFWIDGGAGQNMRLGIGQVDVDPPVETVQEVKVLSNNYSAEYGGSAGGVIIATTKSGGNRFHGGLFEYLRNDALDAANFFAPVTGGKKNKAPLRYNVFGGTFSGPVWTPKKAFGPLGYDGHDKTFFFFAYEGSRRSEGAVRTLTVPSLLQQKGDFSQTFNTQGALIRIYDPATTQVVGGKTVRDPFPNNIIQANRLDPVAVKIMPYYPQPNKAADNLSGANNFSANYQNIMVRNNFTVKVDHQLTSKDKINGRYIYNSDNADFTTVFPDKAADPVAQILLRHQNYLYFGYTRLFTATTINEFRYTYGNRINHQQVPGVKDPWPSRLGLKGVTDQAFPYINVSGMVALGNTNHERQQFPIKQHQLVNNLSILSGRHALKTGLELRQSLNFEVQRTSISGQYTFPTTPTGLPGTGTTGVGLASLLLGFPTNLSVLETEPLDRSSWYLAGFFQDDWTVSHALTLNLGLRWETDTPIIDKDNRMNSFDPTAMNPVSGTLGDVRFAGLNGWPSSPYKTDWKNFGPRIGFAWKPLASGKTVIRGGGGMFFAHPFDHGAPNSAALGFSNSLTLSSPDNGVTAPFYLRDGVPASGLSSAPRVPGYGAVAVGKSTTTAVTFFEQNRKAGYSQQFNLNLQQEMPGKLLLDIGYLANLSRNLPGPNLSINQIHPSKLTAQSTQKDRPFPQYSNVSILFPGIGLSNYHAMVLRMERRFSGGFNFLGTYTWAKFLNDTDEGGSNLGDTGVYSNFYDRKSDYGPSANDIRHRVTLSSVYELPFGSGRKYLQTSPLRHLVGNWGISLLSLFQSGAPFTVTCQTNTTNAFSTGGLRADLVGDPLLSGDQRSIARWFNTSAFAQPAALKFGTGGRGILRSDGIVNFDMSLLKNVPFGDSKNFQLRVELFNLFNHANFGLPGRAYGGAGFGVVSSTSMAARTIQVGMRLVF